jgi:hypothetical protein
MFRGPGASVPGKPPWDSQMSSAHTRRRARVDALLCLLVVILAVVALVISYAGRAVLHAQPFADRAVAALGDPAVQDDVADHVTDALVSSGGGDLVAVRPLVRALAGAAIHTRAFAALFRRAVVEAHTAVVERGGGTAFVNVADAGVLLQGVLQRLAPQAASQLGVERIARLLTLRPGGAALDAISVAKGLYAAVWALGLAAVVLAAAASGVSLDRPRTARQLGIGLAVGGLVLVALYLIGAAVVSAAAPTGRGGAAGALWRAFLAGLPVQALMLAAAGAVVAGAAAAWGRSDSELTGWRRWRSLLGAPVRSRLARSGLALVAGIVVLLEPAAALRVSILAAGLAILYTGAAGLLSELAGRPAVPDLRVRAHRLAGTGVVRLRALAPIAIGLLVAAAAIAVIAAGGGDEAPAATPQTCNGYVALCHRRLNDVVFAATHNSMASVTIKSWLFGQQDGTIRDQLQYGIRGLLIDTYYGEAAGDRVRTDLSTLPKRAAAEQQLGPAAVQAAESIRARIGAAPSGKRQIYLCHGFCELGAVTLASALADLRSFLVTNPGEVVIVVNQDEGVSPADIERAFTQAGLGDLIYRGQLGPFPTMREMIDSGQRLVVMAENDAGSIPWYHLAYRHALQETPFSFKTVEQLSDPAKLDESCRPNRGPASAPLFLLNNWVDTTPVPRASLADVVNAHAVLLRRAQTCQRIRHHRPTLVAVDFYRRGDVIGVVRALNRVGS